MKYSINNLVTFPVATAHNVFGAENVVSASLRAGGLCGYGLGLLGVGFDVGHLPAGLAEFGVRRRRVRQALGKLLAGEAMQFFQEVRREMSKVTWPSWKETWLTTMMVFIMVGFTMVFFFVVDTVLAYGERLLIGAAG